VSLHCFLVEEGALVAAENVGVADHSLLGGELTVARLDFNPSWSGRGTWDLLQRSLGSMVVFHHLKFLLQNSLPSKIASFGNVS